MSHIDDKAERAQRKIGRPSRAEPYRTVIEGILKDEPDLMTLEVLRRARLQGYDGSKSPFYALVAELRPKEVKVGPASRGSPASSRSTTSGRSTCASSTVAYGASSSSPRD